MRFESESIDFSSFGIVVREQPQIWTHDLKKKKIKKTWPGRFRSNLPEHSNVYATRKKLKKGKKSDKNKKKSEVLF